MTSSITALSSWASSLLTQIQSTFHPHLQSTYAVTLLLFILSSSLVYLRWSRGRHGTTHPEKKRKAGDGNPMKDIFEFNRSRGAAAAGGKKTVGADKPFGSSYYYAHNDANAGGGYKDGLKTEDYVMNGPRLLSKGGKLVDDPQSTEKAAANKDDGTSENDNGGGSAPSSSKETASSGSVAKTAKAIPINRYLWDDPGSLDGIAKILIESLPPEVSTGKATNWEDAHITKSDVDAKLGDDGKSLLVTIRHNGKTYQLHVGQLYGIVSEVKTIVKAKRLIVKIQKKKNRLNIWDKSNVKAWPQLSVKPVGGSSSSSGVDYIDEDLFRKGT